MINIFLTFLLMGVSSFGGGVMIIPLLQNRLSDFNAISNSMFFHIIGVGNFIPGPLGVNISFMVGYLQSNFIGGILGVTGFILPGIILTYILIRFLLRNNEEDFIKNKKSIDFSKITVYLMPVISVFFIKSIIIIGEGVQLNFFYVILFLTILFLVMKTKVNYIILIILSGVATLMYSLIK